MGSGIGESERGSRRFSVCQRAASPFPTVAQAELPARVQPGEDQLWASMTSKRGFFASVGGGGVSNLSASLAPDALLQRPPAE